MGSAKRGSERGSLSSFPRSEHRLHARYHCRCPMNGLCPHSCILSAALVTSSTLTEPSSYSSPNSFPLSCLYSASVFSLHGGQTVLLKPQPDHICFAPIFKPPKGFPSHFKQNPPRDLTSGPLTPYLPFSPWLTLVSFNLTGRFVVLEPSQHTPPEGVCSCCSLSMTPSSPRYHLGPCPCFFQVSALSHFLNKASLIT